jgi:hypothetical protein
LSWNDGSGETIVSYRYGPSHDGETYVLKRVHCVGGSCTSHTVLGDSVPDMSAAPHPSAFEGTGTALVAPLPLQRDVVPWVPDPVIDVLATDAGTTTVEVPGFVAVPMGRITVDNPNGDPVSLSGGVLTGTFDVVDGREVAGVDDTVPIGFRNDIVLQRKVRIISTAGTSQSIAIVQVNEDGAAYAVNDWSVS